MSERGIVSEQHILIVDDDLETCEALAEGLSTRGFAPAWWTSAAEAWSVLESEPFDVVLTDLNMRGESGLDLCARIVASRPDLPVVIITAFGTLQTAIGAIRAGAYDFVTKPFELDVLALSLNRPAQHHALRREVTRLRRAATAPAWRASC